MVAKSVSYVDGNQLVWGIAMSIKTFNQNELKNVNVVVNNTTTTPSIKYTIELPQSNKILETINKIEKTESSNSDGYATVDKVELNNISI